MLPSYDKGTKQRTAGRWEESRAIAEPAEWKPLAPLPISLAPLPQQGLGLIRFRAYRVWGLGPRVESVGFEGLRVLGFFGV